MSFLSEMQSYFKGEKATGWAVVGLGILLLLVALYLWKFHRSSLGYGLMIPLLLLGLGGPIGGPFLVTSSNKRIASFTKLYETDKQALIQQELPRMQKVNANWIWLKITWAVLMLLALAVIFFVKREFWTGLALGMLVFCTTAMIVDTFAEHRARAYTQELVKLSTTT